MSIASIKIYFAGWREWELNPIVIKELRQAVRSWAVTGMLLLFLTILFITSVGFLVTESFDVDVDMQLGGSMFSMFLVILAGASVFFIPLYVGVRVAAERQESNPDLFYVSTLSPARIIRGKFLCGAYLALLFFSAWMPFMAFTNLLRGVDLPTVFFILFYLFLVVCSANQIAIFFACLPASRPFKVLIALGGFIASIWLVFPLVMISFEFMRSGVGAMMVERNFWIDTFSALGVGLAAVGLFYILSVALISPPSANRALPVRLYLTAIWLLGGLLSLSWVARTGDVQRMYFWTVPSFVVMVVALLVTISNSDRISLRVRRDIPRSGLKRGLAFVFFNGAAGGLVWVAVILTATYFATRAMMLGFPKSAVTSGEDGHWFAATSAYAFAYALLALFIQRKFLPRRPPMFAALLVLLLAGGWAIFPSIALFFLNQLSWKSVEGLQLGNVFNIFSLREDQQRLYHLYFAFVWLALMILLNAKWFLSQARNFQPHDRTAPENTPPRLK